MSKDKLAMDATKLESLLFGKYKDIKVCAQRGHIVICNNPPLKMADYKVAH